jgi:hypothetical protein
MRIFDLTDRELISYIDNNDSTAVRIRKDIIGLTIIYNTYNNLDIDLNLQLDDNSNNNNSYVNEY